MRTRSSSNLPVVSPNPSTSNPKRHNHRRSKQPFNREESSVDTMADQRTMAELLRAPTEGYAKAIVVLSILAEQFELKHSLINMMTSNQFFGLEKGNPHDHIRCYSNQPQIESINLINVFNNLNEDFLKDLFLTNQPSGNPTFLSHPKLTSPKVKDDIFDPERGNVLPEKLLDLDFTKDLHPPLHVNPLSGSTTYFSSPNQLLEEFADELALITFPPEYDDDLQFDIESDLKEIEYMLHHDPTKDIDSSLNDSIDQSNLADLNNNLFDSMHEMFTDENALDYSSPSLFDEYDDDLFEVEFDTENVYDDPFDSEGEKIKESKLLIDELDLLCELLPSSEYDSFISEDFSRVDTLPSTNNEDKVFNPGILIQNNLFEIITRIAQDKKLAISHASLVIEDFDPPLYELLFFKEVPRSKMLLPFLSENEEKVFKPGIHTSEKFIFLLSQNYLIMAIKFSKSTKFLKAR
nr:reverse transcriptase domain-containing protein [Tanacetum cinerariifolium]